MRTTVILHERLGRWARQLRPRASEWNFRLIESRSIDDLDAAAPLASCPIVIVDFRNRETPPFEDLAYARAKSPTSLILALIPESSPRLGYLAMEAGATATLSAASPPPLVLGQVRRWADLARCRSLARGWGDHCVSTPEPWERLLFDVGIPRGNGEAGEPARRSLSEALPEDAGPEASDA